MLKLPLRICTVICVLLAGCTSYDWDAATSSTAATLAEIESRNIGTWGAVIEDGACDLFPQQDPSLEQFSVAYHESLLCLLHDPAKEDTVTRGFESFIEAAPHGYFAFYSMEQFLNDPDFVLGQTTAIGPGAVRTGCDSDFCIAFWTTSDVTIAAGTSNGEDPVSLLKKKLKPFLDWVGGIDVEAMCETSQPKC